MLAASFVFATFHRCYVAFSCNNYVGNSLFLWVRCIFHTFDYCQEAQSDKEKSEIHDVVYILELAVKSELNSGLNSVNDSS